MGDDHEEINQGSGTILIAEDDPDYRSLLIRRAQKMGLSILEAADGGEAMQIIRRETFDLMVVDLYMPGYNGIDLVNAARKVDPEVQALILTGKRLGRDRGPGPAGRGLRLSDQAARTR